MHILTKNRLIFLMVPILFGTNMLFSQWRDAEEFEPAVTQLFNTIDNKAPGTDTPEQLYNVIKTACEAKDVYRKRATVDNGKHLDQNFDKLLNQWLDLDQGITIRVRLFIYHHITHGKSPKAINQTVEGIVKLAAYYKEQFIPIFMVQDDYKSHPALFDQNGFTRQADKLISEAHHGAWLAESKQTSAIIAATIPAPPSPHDWDVEQFGPAVTKLYTTIEEKLGISGKTYRGEARTPEQLYKIIKAACEAKEVRGKRASDDDDGKHLGEASDYALRQQWANLDLRIAGMVTSFIEKLIKNGRNPAAINQTVADIGTLATYYRNHFIPIFMTRHGIDQWSAPDGFARQCTTIQTQAAQIAQTAIERFGKSAERPAEQKDVNIPGAVAKITQGISAGRPNDIKAGLDALNLLAENNPDLAAAVADLKKAIDTGEEETRDMQLAIISSFATGEGKAAAGIGENKAAVGTGDTGNVSELKAANITEINDKLVTYIKTVVKSTGDLPPDIQAKILSIIAPYTLPGVPENAALAHRLGKIIDHLKSKGFKAFKSPVKELGLAKVNLSPKM